MTIAGVTEVRVPRRCAEAVHQHLRAVGQRGHEGFGLWVGRLNGQGFDVVKAVIPEQTHIRTRDGVCVVLKGGELHRLNVALFRADLTIMAQIHSHPGRAYHSDTDDANAVATTAGCLSLVVPDFARDAFDLGRTASYRLDAAGRWRKIPLPAALQLIKLVD